MIPPKPIASTQATCKVHGAYQSERMEQKTPNGTLLYWSACYECSKERFAGRMESRIVHRPEFRWIEIRIMQGEKQEFETYPDVEEALSWGRITPAEAHRAREIRVESNQ